MIANTQAGVVAARTHWERVALTTWGSYVTEVEKRAILLGHELAPNAPGAALELGCEGGRWSAMLARLGWQMTCTDVNPAALEECRAKIPAARCVQVRPEDRSAPCAAESTGLLLCVEVLPVISSDWLLPEAHRVLVEDGIFVGVFWNLFSFRGVGVALKAVVTRSRHNPYRSAYFAWRRKLRRAGFDLVMQEGFCWFPFGRSSNSSLVPFFTGLERRLGLRRAPSISPWVVFVARKRSLAGRSGN